MQILLSEAWTESLQVGIGSIEQAQEMVTRVALRAELGLSVAAVRKSEDTAQQLSLGSEHMNDQGADRVHVWPRRQCRGWQKD